MINECYLKHCFPPWTKQRNTHIANAIENNESYITQKAVLPQAIQQQPNGKLFYIWTNGTIIEDSPFFW